MSEKQESTPMKEVTPKKTPKLKNDALFKSKTKLYHLHECGNCHVKFKSPAGLKRHKKTNHQENEENKPKTKKKLVKTTVGAHSGVPPNPKLRQAFQGLKAKLEKMKS